MSSFKRSTESCLWCGESEGSSDVDICELMSKLQIEDSASISLESPIFISHGEWQSIRFVLESLGEISYVPKCIRLYFLNLIFRLENKDLISKENDFLKEFLSHPINSETSHISPEQLTKLRSICGKYIPAIVKLGENPLNPLLLRNGNINPDLVNHFRGSAYRLNISCSWSNREVSILRSVGPKENRDSFFSELRKYDPNYDKYEVTFEYVTFEQDARVDEQIRLL